MNELRQALWGRSNKRPRKRQIADIWRESSGHTDLTHEQVWGHAVEMLESNTSAFCLMPEWMQEAMKMLPFYDAVQWMAFSGKWETPPSIGFLRATTYRLNPDYVFEDDAPERPGHIEDMQAGGLDDRKVYKKIIDGEALLEVEMPNLPRGYLLLYQAAAVPDFIAYVYEPGASIKSPDRTLFDKPRIYCYDRGLTFTPTHVSFKKGN